MECPSEVGTCRTRHIVHLKHQRYNGPGINYTLSTTVLWDIEGPLQKAQSMGDSRILCDKTFLVRRALPFAARRTERRLYGVFRAETTLAAKGLAPMALECKGFCIHRARHTLCPGYLHAL